MHFTSLHFTSLHSASIHFMHFPSRLLFTLNLPALISFLRFTIFAASALSLSLSPASSHLRRHPTARRAHAAWPVEGIRRCRRSQPIPTHGVQRSDEAIRQ